MGRSRSKHTVVDFALLGGFGTLCAHEIAYAPSTLTRAGVSHAHLPLLWALASPLAILALGLYVVRSLQSRPGSRGVDPKHLAVAIATAFSVLEMAERATNGLSVKGLLAEQVFWLAMIASPIVAVGLARLVSTAAEVIKFWVEVAGKPEFVLVPATVCGFDSQVQFVSKTLRHSQNRRGPPNRIVH